MSQFFQQKIEHSKKKEYSPYNSQWYKKNRRFKWKRKILIDMHILLLNYEFPPLGGGAAPVTKSLALELGKRGHTFDLITMQYEGLPQEEQEGPIHIHRTPCRRKRKELSTTTEMLSFLRPAYKKAEELIHKKKYDLIHAHFIIPTGILAWRLSKKYHIPYI